MNDNRVSLMENAVAPTTAMQMICKILQDASTPESRIPPTLLFNEGWLLRLVLSAAEIGIPCLPFTFQPGARWFSEALLCSAFLPRYRGDLLAESWTHADGVAGHFRFLPDSKSGLSLDPTGSQFVVLEAKVFSGLSKGTKRAPDYDQAARNVACMAETLRKTRKPVNEWTCLEFYVLAPKVQIEAGVFASELAKTSIQNRIAARIAKYEGEDRTRLEMWYHTWVCPVIDHIGISALDWETIIAAVLSHDGNFGSSLREFYELTLRYNRRLGLEPA